MSEDRNFDDLADRFERRVHRSLKGQIRRAVLARDIEEFCLRHLPDNAQILDIGAGLGHFSMMLAAQGRSVLYNDISEAMCAKAQCEAKNQSVEHLISWHVGPYQSLLEGLEHRGRYQLIVCHALLEWLAEPEQLLRDIHSFCMDGAYLSLCFYNPDGKEYRNLIRGNFDWIHNRAQYQSDHGSLTPNNALSIEKVVSLLKDNGFTVLSESGVRVFSDYVVERRGGLQSDEQVIAMELAYARRQPYRYLGRYYHIVARLHET